MAIRTYTVGDNSGVKRLDELTGSWQNVPLNIPGLSPIILYDVMTDPLDANKVFVCGQRDAAAGNPGIFWSANGGVNWNACLGDVATSLVNGGNAILEIWAVDSLTIYATSHWGYCFKSIDGGITFNHTVANPFVPGFPAPQNETFSRAIHFPTAVNGCLAVDLAGGQIHVQVTTDGGINWTPTDISGPHPSTGFVGGIHMSTDFQTITLLCENQILRSTDGGITFVVVYSVPGNEQAKGVHLLHLSWTSDADLWAYGSKSKRLNSTDGAATWNTISPFQTSGFMCRAGHHYDNTPPHDGFFSENNDILSTSDSSLTGTLSEANQFSGGIEAVWTGIADTPISTPGCTDPTATNFNPLANADCAGVKDGIDYSCCSYNPPTDDPCNCPPGYSFDEATNLCTLVETTPANCLPNTILIDRGDKNGQYSQQGANFYPDVTTLPWPLSDIVTGTNVNNLQDSTLTPLIALQTVDNPLWGGPTNPNAGRLYDIGVWTNLPQISGDEQPVNEWIGFTACVTVPVTGTYSIGFGGDNRVRLTLDGDPFAEVGANGGSYAFWYWSVVEVTLTAGQHVITIEGYNLSGPASFAAEIYSANVATLIPMTTPAQLAAVTVWSTGDFIPISDTVPTVPFALGEESGCSCPNGWVLSNCNGELECIQTTVVPATPCNCYLATNCDDPNDTELITIDPTLPPLDLNVTYVFEEFGDKCWTIEVSSNCGANPGEVILLNTGFVDVDDNLGAQGEPDFNWKLVEDGSGVIPPQAAFIAKQNWYNGGPIGTPPNWGTIPAFPSTPESLWITQTIYNAQYAPPGDKSYYELEFNLPAGFVPNVNFDILSDNQCRVFLNGNLIADNSNPSNYPNSWYINYNFATSNPTDFIPQVVGGPQVLRVEIFDSVGTTSSNGFNIRGFVESLVVPDPSTEVTVTEIFTDCDACLGVCYRLVDCEGLLDSITTNTELSGDLEAYVGQVVMIATCPKTCWQLEEIECPLDVIETIEIIESFPDCITCLPQDVPLPLIIRNRTVKPGYDTVGCSPEYVQRISCDWSEALFQEMASKRYGIEFCCGKDLPDLTVKKELLDLKMITDPDACKMVPNDCCPPCNVVATLMTFAPIACLPPTGTMVILDVPNPVILPNCAEATLSVDNAYTPLDPDIPLVATGTDCCGFPFEFTFFVSDAGVPPAEAVVICIDLNQPYAVDTGIVIASAGNCDCDPEPPFDCFCIQPATADDQNGSITGTACDGTELNVVVFPTPPGSVNPNPTICVRADGTAVLSDNVSFTNNGACDELNPCSKPPLCVNVTLTNTGTDVDGDADVDVILCTDSPRTITVHPGETTIPICVINGSIAAGPLVTITTIGPCT